MTESFEEGAGNDGVHLQRYSQSRRFHGSRPFHWFAWYNS